MGSTSRYGRATINPSAPEAVGVCDRCGKLFNLRDLRFQFDWAGTSMISRQVRVCTVTCYDAPQEQLRTIMLPPDPPPVWQPRFEPYDIDEANHFIITASFDAIGRITASLDSTPAGVLIAAFSDLGTLAVTLHLGLGLTAALTATGTISAVFEGGTGNAALRRRMAAAQNRVLKGPRVQPDAAQPFVWRRQVACMYLPGV